MALTASQEAQVIELIAQQAALLTLADNEALITSKLGAAQVELSDLTPAVAPAGTDLLLTRQGTTDKSITPAVLLGSLFDSAALEAIAPLVPAADQVPYFNGASTAALSAFTATARALLASGSAAGMRAVLDLEPGIDVQAYDTDLAAIAALATTAYGRSLLTLADANALFTFSGAAASWAFSIGGVFTVTGRDISPTANTSADFAYGNGHTYATFARAWVEGDDNPAGTSSDRSVWISQTPTVSSARVRNDGDSTATCWLFSFGV